MVEIFIDSSRSYHMIFVGLYSNITNIIRLKQICQNQKKSTNLSVSKKGKLTQKCVNGFFNTTEAFRTSRICSQ